MADRMLAAVKRDEDQADVSLRPQTNGALHQTG